MLQKQNIDIVFGKGVDKKTSKETVLYTSLETLQNGFWAKSNKVKKRNGYEAMTRAIANNIATIAAGRSLKVLKDELLQFSDDTLYSKSDTINEWVERGDMQGPNVEQRSIIQNQHGQSTMDCAEANSIEVYAWRDTRGGVRASIFDRDSNIMLLSDIALDASATNIRCCGVDDTLFVVYSNGANLKGRSLDTTDPVAGFGSEFTIAADLNTTTPGFDIVEYDSGAFAFCYVKTLNTEMGVGYVKEDEAVGNGSNGYAAPVTVTDIFDSTSMQIFKHPSDGSVYIIFYSQPSGLSDGGIFIFARESDLTSKLGVTDVDVISFPYPTTPFQKWFRVGACFYDANNIRAYWETQGKDFEKAFTDKQITIKTASISDTGTVGSISNFLYRAQLASHPFLNGTETYVNVIYTGYNDQVTTPLTFSVQPTQFTVRQDAVIVAKHLQSLAGYESAVYPTNDEIFCTSRVISHGSGVFSWAGLKTSFRAPDPIEVGDDNPHHGVGIVRLEVDLNTLPKIVDETLGETIHFLPNILHHFDGISLVEHGFHLFPEGILSFTDVSTITTTQQGNAGQPEKTELVCVGGYRYKTGQTFDLYNAAGTLNTVVFRVDGETIPGGITWHIIVDINSTDSAAEVATAVINDVGADVDFNCALVVFTTTEVEITNAANGAVTDSSITDLNDGVLSDGTYSYRAVYSWVDINGELHRSSPSPPVSAVLSAGTALQSASIGIPPLQFTRKKSPISDVVIELYRTEANGTIYYKITDLTDPLFNDPDSTSELIFFLDNAISDSDLISNEILYTTGGVVENIAPPAAKYMTVLKNTMYIGGFVDDRLAIWVSKTKTQGVGVSFSDFFFIRADPLGGDVKGLATLDEKLIIFKETATQWTTGEGPDDAGTGQTLIEPQFATRDIGLEETLSIAYIPDGILFKSQKGYYLLDRALNPSYIGAPVEEWNNLTVTEAVTIEDLHQVRWTHSDGRVLMYDYFEKQWSTWTNLDAEGCAIWKSVFVLLKSDGTVWKETDGVYVDPTSTQIELKLRTGWIKLANLQGFQRIRRCAVQGELLLDYKYELVSQVDFIESDVDTFEFTPTAADKDFEAHLSRQKCKAMRLQLRDVAVASSFKASEFTGFTLEAGLKKGTFKLPAASKVGAS